MSIGIDETIQKIFSAVIVGGVRRDNPLIATKQATYQVAMPRFLARFPSNIFTDEYAFFYEVINTLKIKVFSKNQLKTILENNSDLILTSPYIDMSKWANTIDNRPSTDEEKVEAFSLNVQDIYEQLSNQVVTPEEFNSACKIYIDYYTDKSMLQAAQNMTLIMSDTGYLEKKTRGRSVLYKGKEDAQKYYNERVKIIRELSEEAIVKDTVVNEKWLVEEMEQEDSEDEDALLSFGLAEIDSTIGFMRRSNVIGILGAPKSGKTRVTNYLVNKALEAGLNVAVWPLEGTQAEWIACQTAAFIRTTSGQRVNSRRILEKKYENNDIKQLVLAAKTRIATDHKRGRLSFIGGTAYVEDFIDILQSHYDNENPFDIIVIDQLINIMSRTRKGKVERISEAYMLLKDYITNKMTRKALAIIPCQMKQDVVDFLRKNPGETIDVTAGAESAETIRSPDEVIGIFSNKEERMAGLIKLYSVASRHSGSFEDFFARAEYECCNFYSDAKLNQ